MYFQARKKPSRQIKVLRWSHGAIMYIVIDFAEYELDVAN
jgi:hypothetical protein